MKPAYILALLVLAVSLGVTLYAFSGAIAQHVTIAEARTRAGQTVQVPGRIIKDSVDYKASANELRFDVEEMNAGGAGAPERLTIVYRQPKPENFDSAVSVEAVGVYRDGVFYAQNLLVKCPSKYNDKQEKGAAPGPAAPVKVRQESDLNPLIPSGKTR